MEFVSGYKGHRNGWGGGAWSKTHKESSDTLNMYQHLNFYINFKICTIYSSVFDFLHSTNAAEIHSCLPN